MNLLHSAANVQPTPPKIFWGELAPSEHLVQIYTDTEVFLNTLERFVGGGLQAGESVIVIATTPHLIALHQRLVMRGFNLEAARARHQYISMEAAAALAKFIVRGWPDDQLFEQFVHELLARAYHYAHHVRAFGEMVALLWASGRSGATLRLEELWQQFCQKNGLALLCAYPRSGVTQDVETSLQEICATHSRLIAS